MSVANLPKWITVMSSTLYRCDDISQFVSHAESKAASQAVKEKRSQDAKPHLDLANMLLDFNVVLGAAGTDHLRLMARGKVSFSLPEEAITSATRM